MGQVTLAASFSSHRRSWRTSIDTIRKDNHSNYMTRRTDIEWQSKCLIWWVYTMGSKNLWGRNWSLQSSPWYTCKPADSSFSTSGPTLRSCNRWSRTGPRTKANFQLTLSKSSNNSWKNSAGKCYQNNSSQKTGPSVCSLRCALPASSLSSRPSTPSHNPARTA